MAVYVDSLEQTERTRVWPFDDRCRLLADSERELEEMATKLGLERKWRSDERSAGKWMVGLLVHYPITGGKRAAAVRMGAREITTEQAELMRKGAGAKTGESDGCLFGGGGRML